MNKCVMVTGGSGFIGQHTVSALAAGNPEWSIILAEPHPATQSSPRETVWLDLSKPIACDAEPDIIVHLAGEKNDPNRMMEINGMGTRRLMEWAGSRGVQKVIYLSSVGVYGAPFNGGLITERSLRQPTNEYEKSKLYGEEAVRELAEKYGIAYTILQPSNVVGLPASGEYPLLRFMQMIQKGVFVYFGHKQACFNYVAVEDVAASVVASLNNRASGHAFIINTPIPMEEAAAVTARALNCKVPRLVLPAYIGHAAAAAGDAATRITGRTFPFGTDRFQELTNQTCFQGDYIEKQLAFVYPCGIRNALANLVNRYREKGLIR